VREPIWVEEGDALTMQDRLLSLHAGAAGLRAEDLLNSAQTRPQQQFAYDENSDIIDMATAHMILLLTFGPTCRPCAARFDRLLE
jgi:death-on-curing protein